MNTHPVASEGVTTKTQCFKKHVSISAQIARRETTASEMLSSNLTASRAAANRRAAPRAAVAAREPIGALSALIKNSACRRLAFVVLCYVIAISPLRHTFATGL